MVHESVQIALARLLAFLFVPTTIGPTRDDSGPSPLTLAETMYACTLKGCSFGNPCCNHCQGLARAQGTDFERIAGLVCLGNECASPSCGVIDARGFNVLDGVEVELRGRVVDEQGFFRLKDVVVGVQRGERTVFLIPERDPWE